MPDNLYGLEKVLDRNVELVENETTFINTKDIMISKVIPTLHYIKDDAGKVYVEKLNLKNGKCVYYMLHSSEIYQERLGTENHDHGIYSLV